MLPLSLFFHINNGEAGDKDEMREWCVVCSSTFHWTHRLVFCVYWLCALWDLMWGNRAQRLKHKKVQVWDLILRHFLKVLKGNFCSVLGCHLKSNVNLLVFYNKRLNIRALLCWILLKWDLLFHFKPSNFYLLKHFSFSPEKLSF